MKEAIQIHREAMAIADTADGISKIGNTSQAIDTYLTAFLLDQKAARKVRRTKKNEPTRSILYQSAASLAMQAREYESAERLICEALRGFPPPVVANELRELWDTVSFSRHLHSRGITMTPAHILLSIWGEGVGHGCIEYKNAAPRYNALYNLIYRTAERLNNVEYDEGRKSQNLRRQYHIYTTVPQAASYALAFRIGSQQEQLTLPFAISASTVIQNILETFDNIEHDNTKAIEMEFEGQEAYKNNFFGLASRIVPDGRSVRHVGLATTDGRTRREVPIRKSRPQIREIASRILPPDKPHASYETIQGNLQAADSRRASQGMITVKSESGKDYEIAVPKGMMADVVRPYFEKYVSIEVINLDGKLSLQDIHSAEDTTSV